MKQEMPSCPAPVPPRLAAHGRRVRPGPGLGEGVGGEPFTGRDLREQPILLLLGAGEPEREGAELLHGEDQANRGVRLGDLLHRHQEHERTGRRASQALVEREPEDLVLAEELDHVPREVAGLVDLRRARRDALPRQRSDELADLTLFLGKRVPRHTTILWAVVGDKPRVQVVVVVPEKLDHSARTGQAGVRADEHELGACGDEAVDEILGETVIDLRGNARRPLAPVGAWVVDVDVEAVLVRDVAWAERAAVAVAEIANPQARRRWVSVSVFVHDPQYGADEEVCPPAPTGAVGPPVQERVPGEVAWPGCRELDSPQQASVGRSPERARVAPSHALLTPSRSRTRDIHTRRREPERDGRQDDQADCPHSGDT
jgi:hypothetical protein